MLPTFEHKSLILSVTCAKCDGYTTQQSIGFTLVCTTVSFFTRLGDIFLGYDDPINTCRTTKINNFWGDLTDVLAMTRNTGVQASSGFVSFEILVRSPRKLIIFII